jgi:hypothetical protein
MIGRILSPAVYSAVYAENHGTTAPRHTRLLYPDEAGSSETKPKPFTQFVSVNE